MTNTTAIQRALVLLLVTLMLAGCGTYAIQGRVVRGASATIQVVDKNDRRMTENNPTGGGAVIQGILEPNTPSEMKSLGQVVTDGQGNFSIPVEALGSSFLEYEAMLIARREGHSGAMATSSVTFLIPVFAILWGTTIGETVAYALGLPNSAVVAEILVNSRLEPMF